MNTTRNEGDFTKANPLTDSTPAHYLADPRSRGCRECGPNLKGTAPSHWGTKYGKDVRTAPKSHRTARCGPTWVGRSLDKFNHGKYFAVIYKRTSDFPRVSAPIRPVGSKGLNMKTKIVVAGATGNLGTRITKSLVDRRAAVVALIRTGAPANKSLNLSGIGATLAVVDMADPAEVAKACSGATCIVSAVQGLSDVIVDVQSVLLEGAIAAGIRRFIPSDFSTDFTKLPAGENRNFDLRRAFHERLDGAAIKPTAIFNGAFAEILTYNVPVLDFKKKANGYWDDPDWRMDSTTMDDTAAYTAAAAMDLFTPVALRVASFRISPNDLVRYTTDVLKDPFKLVRMGTRPELAAHNKAERAAYPEGENEIYPRWQQGQYMQSMFSAQHVSLDNDRYPDLRWTTLHAAAVATHRWRH
jgi:hypothetical protein